MASTKFKRSEWEDRTIFGFLDISASCDFNCIFCENRKLIFNNFFQIKKEILLIKSKGFKSIVIGGTEPLNHPEILRIIKEAKKIFNFVKLQTSSPKLAEKIFWEKIIIQGGVDQIFLPIYGVSPATHDRIVGVRGAFVKLIGSLENFKKGGKKPWLHTLILKQNIEEILKLVNFIRANYPGFFFQIDLPRPSNSQIDYSQLMPNYSKIEEIIKQIVNNFSKKYTLKDLNFAKGLFSFNNYPTCVIIKAFRGSENLKKLFSLKYKDDVSINWTYSNKCQNCIVNKKCLGVPKKYLDIYGEEGLSTIKKYG